MDIAIIYRQGRLHLLSYKGLDRKKRYIIKRCPDGWRQRSADETTTPFSAFQRKLKNREQAEKLNNRPLFDRLMADYKAYSAKSFKETLKVHSRKGVWGIELEDFLKREASENRLFSSTAECYQFIQRCWQNALTFWQRTDKVSPTRCLELLFNFEERLGIEVKPEGIGLIEDLVALRDTLKTTLEKEVPVATKLMSLYMYYGLYEAAQALAQCDKPASQHCYMDALFKKAKNNEFLSFVSPVELSLLLEKVIECSHACKDSFEYYSSGHHKWQQVTLCVGPLLSSIKEKINGNLFKNTNSISELASMHESISRMVALMGDKLHQKKATVLLKAIASLYHARVHEQASALLLEQSA